MQFAEHVRDAAKVLEVIEDGPSVTALYLLQTLQYTKHLCRSNDLKHNVTTLTCLEQELINLRKNAPVDITFSISWLM